MHIPFTKYHALGNDYLILDPETVREIPDAGTIRRICHRQYGLGADGILWGPLATEDAEFSLRIFNPDGSEAEKSGNGLRIFSRYLYDQGRVGCGRFSVHTAGGIVHCQVLKDTKVAVEMGTISFDSSVIPVAGERREVLGELLTVGAEQLRYYALSIGNPHCVLPVETASALRCQQLGPLIERHPNFPQRTNVQLLQVVDRNSIRIEIWERGAGYTLASGSSSSAAAAVAYKMGLCDRQIAVHMPGGVIDIVITPTFEVTMTGPVTRIGRMVMEAEALQWTTASD